MPWPCPGQLDPDLPAGNHPGRKAARLRSARPLWGVSTGGGAEVEGQPCGSDLRLGVGNNTVCGPGLLLAHMHRPCLRVGMTFSPQGCPGNSEGLAAPAGRPPGECIGDCECAGANGVRQQPATRGSTACPAQVCLGRYDRQAGPKQQVEAQGRRHVIRPVGTAGWLLTHLHAPSHNMSLLAHGHYSWAVVWPQCQGGQVAGREWSHPTSSSNCAAHAR